MEKQQTTRAFGKYLSREIDIRDTYILPWNGKYYMYGTQGFQAFTGTPGGFLCYVGEDLEHWEGPYTVFPNDGRVWATNNFWAPEVYEVDGTLYLFAAWSKSSWEDKQGGIEQHICVLKADNPLGPFQVVNDDMGIGNDPTLYKEDGRYYLIHNDTMTHMQAHLLSSDFSSFEGETIPMFTREQEDVTWSVGGPTEGAETFVTPSGKLLVLWSSFCRGSSKKFESMGFHNMDYGTAIAYAESGSIRGPFKQENVMITPPNMGHVNLFYALDGSLMLATHWPDDDNNELGCSTPIFFPVDYLEAEDTIRIRDSKSN